MGYLGNDGGETVVVGRSVKNVTTAQGRTPRYDLRSVNPVKRTGVGQSRAPVFMLTREVQQFSWLTRAGSEMAIIEDQDGVASLGEAIGVGIQPQFSHRPESMTHDDDRRLMSANWTVQPGCAVPIT